LQVRNYAMNKSPLSPLRF